MSPEFCEDNNMSFQEQKKELRRIISGRRDALTEDELAALSIRVGDNLFACPEFERAQTIMFFAAFRSEVHTVPMMERALAAGKRVLTPVSLVETHELLPCEVRDVAADLAPGAYDIPEPPPDRRRAVPAEEIDFLCLPGLGFDRSGNRLGYGGGYYDRFLERLREDTVLAALAFSFQMVDSVPAAPHDKPVQLVITDKEIIRCT